MGRQRTRVHSWIDRYAEGTALGLARSQCCVFDGWQIGPGGYAANGITTQVAAEPPTGFLRLFPTAQGVWALSSSAGTCTLHLSADGIAEYSLKLSTAAGRMHELLPLLIDCGNDRLIMAEYCTDSDPITNNTNRLWGSEDAGENWSTLFTTEADSIRHFHGGYYDASQSVLYLFTGDANVKCSILMCADVEDLFDNPNTWKERWGLTNATRSTLDADYVVGWNSQLYRTCLMVARGDYLYYGMDSNVSGGVEMRFVGRVSHKAGKVWIKSHSTMADVGMGVGEIWQGGITDNGLLVMNTSARESDLYGDGLSHFYLLDPNQTTMHEVFACGPKPADLALLADSIHTVGGFTVMSFFNDRHDPLIGNFQQRYGTYQDPSLLRPLLRARGVRKWDRLLLPSGDALLTPAGDAILGPGHS